ncbi:MAG TPA: universal stress protein [Thermodesulfovibrionales bacterium]|nr:universal stress protein [Thermodesulfovibrionales bacterium]
MRKVLVVVDEMRSSEPVVSVFDNLVRPPEEVILLYVERLEGRSLMIDMLGEAELSTLRESLSETEYKEKLDRRAEKVLSHYKKKFSNGGLVKITTIIREGIPAEEVARVAEEENVELVIIGSDRERGLNRLIFGCVSEQVERSAGVPVVVAKKTAEEKAGRLRERDIFTAA